MWEMIHLKFNAYSLTMLNSFSKCVFCFFISSVSVYWISFGTPNSELFLDIVSSYCIPINFGVHCNIK